MKPVLFLDLGVMKADHDCFISVFTQKKTLCSDFTNKTTNEKKNCHTPA